MANYRKSFNLRNGVQVDDDNFVVNANGLVGIGTSVPTETLDIHGNAKVVGLVTASSVSTPSLRVTGVGTFTTLTDGTVRINSGIISALSGIVTYYGDGAGLVNIPTSQWVDVNPGLGQTSIYAIGRVGIATTNPSSPYFLQIGLNPDTDLGVGINSRGDIKASGIVTAGTFSGTLSGNVYSTGISTFTQLNSTNVSAGVITATTFFGSLTGVAQSASSLTGTPNINVAVVTATDLQSSSSTIGIATISTELDVGTGGTAFTALNSGRIGVGTAIPTSELQIRKSSGSLLEVISDSGQSRISVGQVTGVGSSTGVIRFGSSDKTFDILNNDTGNINMYLHAGPSGVGTGRFAWLYGQSNAELASLTYDGKLGIGITNPTTNLHVVGTSTVTGNANFGSNVTITGNLTVGSLTLPSVINNTNLNNTSGISTFNRIEVTSNTTLSGNVIVSSAASVGLGTTQPIVDLDARGKNALFGGIGINTNVSQGGLTVVGGGTFSSGVGIGTTTTNAYLGVYGNVDIYPSPGIQAASINIYSGEILTNNRTTVGLGTTSARSALDFADVGKGFAGGTNAFMIVPRATTAERALFGTGVGGIGTAAGAIIFNTTTNKFQGYTGIAWTDLH